MAKKAGCKIKDHEYLYAVPKGNKKFHLEFRTSHRTKTITRVPVTRAEAKMMGVIIPPRCK